MAEERRSRAAGRLNEQAPEAVATAAPLVTKKKKLGKGSLLFIFLLLAFGVGTGLHFSGVWDARPLVWETIPRIPYVGETIANFLGIPEHYTLTVDERRTHEQNERQRRLDERERNLLEREAAVEIAMADIDAGVMLLAELETLLGDNSAQRAEDAAAAAAESDQIARIRRDFATMSSRNAAQIIEEMADESLAVELLQGMTGEARAAILSRMDARRAARLVELLSATQ